MVVLVVVLCFLGDCFCWLLLLTISQRNLGSRLFGVEVCKCRSLLCSYKGSLWLKTSPDVLVWGVRGKVDRAGKHTWNSCNCKDHLSALVKNSKLTFNVKQWFDTGEQPGWQRSNPWWDLSWNRMQLQGDLKYEDGFQNKMVNSNHVIWR